MAIIGINMSGFHSSAALIDKGKIKAAITEERLTRIKRDKSFPKNSIEYCLKVANISQKQITDIFIGWNPIFYLKKSDNTLFDSLKDRGKLAYLALNELSILNDENIISIKEQIKTVNSCWDIHFVNHHYAHLSNVFFLSGFDDSDFFMADGFGEHTTGCTGDINFENIRNFSDFRSPHSLGSFYSTFTQFLGFQPNGDEWKLMALASLGNPDKYYGKVKNLIRVDDLNFELDLSYFEHFLYFTEKKYSSKLISTFGNPVKKHEELKQDHYDIVASVQKVAEDVSMEILNNLYKRTKNKNIVVSGGFFMNSVLNGKILENTPYENIFIGGSPDDSGVSIGSALYGWNFIKKNRLPAKSLNHNYFGQEFSNIEIIEELEKRKIDYEVVEKPESLAAKKLRDKKVVAWFQGRSEFGQRALGNRSILADPTFEDIKDVINSSIKYRESFRPFAPSVLEEKQNNYFLIPKNQKSYFMEKVFLFKEEFRNKLPGVVHYDGSGRLQTVKKTLNPKYYRLIQEYEKLSGFGIVLNTSFNINGMPLVETPSDAIDCFYQSGIDILFMNNVVVMK
tara:strand:- start:235 stop:1932 length:1698 start_codon:yes stop_codon:yes gene_type:complete